MYMSNHVIKKYISKNILHVYLLLFKNLKVYISINLLKNPLISIKTQYKNQST